MKSKIFVGPLKEMRDLRGYRGFETPSGLPCTYGSRILALNPEVVT